MGLRRSSGGSSSGGSCTLLPLGAAAWEHDSSNTGLRSQGAGGHSPGSCIPRDRRRPEGHKTGRTLLPPGAPKLCRSATAAPGHPGQCGQGTAVVTAGLTPGLGNWPPPVVLFLLVSPCAWDGVASGNRALRGKQLPLSRAPCRGRAASPGSHT